MDNSITIRRATAQAAALLLLAGSTGVQAGNSYQAAPAPPAPPAAVAQARPSALAPPARPATTARTPVRQTRHARRVVVRKRKLSHSAAIIGGSAAWGAAIGAIAGGGPGAAIGALAAGGGGFIYDHFTRRKRVVE